MFNERTRFLGVLFVSLLAFFLILTACDMFGSDDDGNDDNSPPSASVTANTTDPVVGDTVDLDASSSSDPDGDELTFSWTLETPGGSDATLSSPTTARPWYVPDTSGDYRAEVVVGDSKLSDTDNVSITALKELPETVTVPVENVAADGDSLIAGTVTWEDSVVAEDVRSAEVTIPSSRDEGQLCVQESDLFAEGCKTLTPTSDISQVQEISVQRKSVTYTITPDVPYGEQSAVDVSVSGSKVFEGSGSVDVPKLSADKSRVVSGNLETADQDNSSKVDRLYADTTISSFGNIDLTLVLSRLDACSDDIDNDGDSAIDENDTRACTDLDGNYDPEDDNEILYSFARTTGVYPDDSIYVSSAEENRSANIRSASNPLPVSVTVAKGEIFFRIEAKRPTDISGQTFAIHIRSGSGNDNLTIAETSDVVADVDTSEGWNLFRVHGIDRSFFADGAHYAIDGWHGTKARDEQPGDGNDRLYFYAEEKNSRLHQIIFDHEPEDVPDNKAKSFGSNVMNQITTLGRDECLAVSQTDEVCRVPAQSSEF